jgi:hypothetical protein
MNAQEALDRMWEGLPKKFKQLGLAYSDKQALQELVDRATPKKVGRLKAYPSMGTCPSCEIPLSIQPFCEQCGQALDWSSEQIAKGETK